MFKRDINTRTVIVQDDSVKQIFDPDQFVSLMNSVVRLYSSEDTNTPAPHYKNALFNDTNAYNDYIALTVKMAEQFTGLTGRLKQNGLPVIMPDATSFINKFKEIQNYSEKDFKKAIREEVISFGRAMAHSIEANLSCAKKHNIPTEPVKINKKGSDKTK